MDEPVALQPHPAMVYARGVIDESIPAGKLIRLAAERHMRDLENGAERGLHFDRMAAERVIRFFGFLKHSKGEWEGKPFRLEPWQQFMVWCIFGWMREDGLRRFRTAYIEVPRKNGKSTLVAGLGLYLMLADDEPGAEVYSAATKRDQAKISWEEGARMVQASPDLAEMIQHWRSSDTLCIPGTASKFQPLGADQNTMDGLNVHGAMIDELHAHRNRGVFDILDTATGSRRQPLIVEITTAGSDQASICFEHHEYSRQILEGTIEDDAWFAYVACLDEGDEWTEPHVWAKANPNLGVSVKEDDLKRQAIRAAQLPAQQNAFRRLRLNQWTQQTNRWIDLGLWDANAGNVDEELLKGRPCYGGLDLANVSDIVAWIMAFPDERDSEALDVLCRFWCPEARLLDKENKYREQYQAWEREGYLYATPGDAVDYGFIRQSILDDAQIYDVQDVNVDRLFQGYQLSQELADQGMVVFGMGQGFLSMAVPMKEFERRLLLKKIHHGGHPVLRWMADNVAVRQDPAGNLKPDKAASQGKIDGIVALVMAIDRATRHQPKKKSTYEDHGLMAV